MTEEEAKDLVKESLKELKRTNQVPKEHYVAAILARLSQYGFSVYCPSTGRPLRDVKQDRDGLLNYYT